MEDFVVRHYNSDEAPMFKGNGFDGIRVGEDREEAQRLADYINALRKDAERYRWLLSQLAGMKRADFFEPLRQHFYDTDEKYPDADDVQVAIDAAMLERVGVGAA